MRAVPLPLPAAQVLRIPLCRRHNLNRRRPTVREGICIAGLIYTFRLLFCPSVLLHLYLLAKWSSIMVELQVALAMVEVWWR